ncbi:MAG: chromosomal replication initiator protein DnaA [Bacteroidales bacterium]|jgi:chromosomal replication initiator protein|nr:chromosomal replication initiator protein DnaA [Bacteroidales bacterium]
MEISNDCKQVWDRCLAFIKDNLPEVIFETWFRPIEAVSLKDEELTIKVPSLYFYEWIEAHYIKLLEGAIKKEIGPNAKLLYRADIDKNSPVGSSVIPSFNKDITNNPMKPAPVIINDSNVKEIPNPFIIPGLRKIKIDSQLNENYSFDNFVEGPCNQLARCAGYAVAQNPGKTPYNPLLIFSSVGLGKTHLAHAIGLETKRLHPDQTVLYISAEQFFQQFIDASKNKTGSDFLQFYQRMVDVLIIDDIQLLMNKEKTQEIFFQVFNGLHAMGKQIIITSDKSPAEISGLQPRVLSRLKWGMSAELQVPDVNTRIKIIKKKIYNDGIQMPEDVIEYLAYNVNTSIRELEGALISILAQSSISKKEITIELARQMVDKFVKSNTREITIEYIQKIVCDYFDITMEKMLSNTRKGDIVAARHISMYLARKLTKASLVTIGMKCGNKDHATVLHACKSISNSCETNKSFRIDVEEIEKRIVN